MRRNFWDSLRHPPQDRGGWVAAWSLFCRSRRLCVGRGEGRARIASRSTCSALPTWRVRRGVRPLRSFFSVRLMHRCKYLHLCQWKTCSGLVTSLRPYGCPLVCSIQPSDQYGKGGSPPPSFLRISLPGYKQHSTGSAVHYSPRLFDPNFSVLFCLPIFMGEHVLQPTFLRPGKHTFTQ